MGTSPLHQPPDVAKLTQGTFALLGELKDWHGDLCQPLRLNVLPAVLVKGEHPVVSVHQCRVWVQLGKALWEHSGVAPVGLSRSST